MFINFPRPKLRRDVGLVLLCLIGIDATLSGGIFVLLSHGAAAAGEYLPLSFLLGGVLAFLGALVYAEVGTSIPRSGADLAMVFNTTSRKYYPFIFAWLVLLGDVSFLAINALGFAYYAQFVLDLPVVALGSAALLAATLINLRGIGNTSRIEGFTAATLAVLLSVFAIMVGTSAQFSVDPGGYLQALPAALPAVIAGTSLIFATFAGYEYIATIAEEAKRPEINIPRALIITVVTATLLFVGISWVAVHTVPTAQLAASDAPLLSVAQTIGRGQYLVIIAALIATFGSLVAGVLVSSRRLYALSREGYFKSFFAPLNGRRVPARSIVGVMSLGLLLLLSQSVPFMAYLSNIVYLLGLMVISGALVRLRRLRPYLPRPFRMPLVPFLPWFLIGLSALVVTFTGGLSLLVTLLWALLGFLVYIAAHHVHRSALAPMLFGMVILLGALAAVGLLL